MDNRDGMSQAKLRWLPALVLAAAVGIGLTATSEAGPQAATRIGEVPWFQHLQVVESALVRRDLDAAERAWQEAYLSALGSWRWEGMLEVAQAYLRIGRAAGRTQASVARARNLYLAAFFRAREQRSLDGALRTAEAFARLGDRDMVEQCLRIAEALAAEARDPHAPARIRAFAARLTDRAFAAADTARPAEGDRP
jgi:hypothetical protein